MFLLALEAVRRHLAAGYAAAYASNVVPRQALVWMLERATATWGEQGAQFDDYADFTRDGFRCMAPGDVILLA